jgi:hypothetical protein
MKGCRQKVRAKQPNMATVHRAIRIRPSDGMSLATNHALHSCTLITDYCNLYL